MQYDGCMRSLLRVENLHVRMAMLFILHDLAVAGQIAGQAAVMRGGRVVETGPGARLLTAPAHPYTKQPLAAAPTLRSDREMPLAQVSGN